MLIVDVIREADSDHEIYFLVTSYVEAVRYCDPLRLLPMVVRELPLNDVEDVTIRVEMLRAILESPDALSDEIRLVLAEALDIFGMARHRLDALREEYQGALLEAA